MVILISAFLFGFSPPKDKSGRVLVLYEKNESTLPPFPALKRQRNKINAGNYQAQQAKDCLINLN